MKSVYNKIVNDKEQKKHNNPTTTVRITHIQKQKKKST